MLVFALLQILSECQNTKYLNMGFFEYYTVQIKFTF
jgi:hypothetical protein